MENAEDKPNYYSVIPADVRYDKELTANAKLLYGEISALCSKNGKCWATNGYFAKLYNTTPRTISKWITSLISKGYIYSELDMDAGKRTLKICMNFFSEVEENFAEDRKNVHDNIEEMFYTPLEENFQQNNININNTRINNKNINNNPNPSSWKNKTYFEDTELNDLFLDFLDLRKKIGNVIFPILKSLKISSIFEFILTSVTTFINFSTLFQRFRSTLFLLEHHLLQSLV